MKNILIFVTAAIFIMGNIFNVWADLAVDLDEIVVTHSRIEQKNFKIASNVTVITQEQIEASNAQNLPDILRDVQGINVYDNSTNKTATIDIRGYGDTASRNVLILVDGRKINSIDISGPNLDQIPIESVERIEIIRGAGSVLYGDNAVGGVVNIITKQGKGDLHGRVGDVYDSYNSNGEHWEVSGSHNRLSYYLFSRYLDQKGYRANSDGLSKDFNTRLGYEFSKQFSTDLEVAYHKDDTRLPGGLSDTNLSRLGRRASTNEDDFASTKDRNVKLSLNLQPQENMEYGKFTVDLLYRNRDVYDEFNTFGPFHTKRSIDTYGMDGKYVFDRTLFGREVNFVTGVDYYDHTHNILGSGDNVDDITIKKKEVGVYDFMQFELLDKLFVSGGTRYNKAMYDFDQRNVIVHSKQSPDKWVNSGGLKYEYARGSNLHFNWQETFRFLATDEWYSTANFPGFGITPGLNLNLKQQSGVQYEAGIKHDFNDAVIVDVTPYFTVNHNEIFFDPVTFGNSNYDKTRRGGIEFGQKTDLLKFINISFLNKLELATSYTYQDARFDKGANNKKEIPMVPVHAASQSITAEFLKYYNVSFTDRYVGSRFAINDVLNETPPIKPYMVLDGKLAYKRSSYEFYVAANNILNAKYSNYVAKSTFSSAKSYYPSPERNFNLGVDLKF